MPNHVTNILKTDDPKVLEACRAPWDDGGPEHSNQLYCPMDFRAIKPPPECLPEESMPLGATGIAARVLKVAGDRSLDEFWGEIWGQVFTGLDQWERKQWESPDHERLAQACAKSLKECGWADWYTWNIDSWGTKWNAYRAKQVDENTISFETAWSTPMPIFQALADRFPDAKIEVLYADEDFGSNCGSITFHHHKMDHWTPKDSYSAQAREFAATVLYPDGLPPHLVRTKEGHIRFVRDEEEKALEDARKAGYFEGEAGTLVEVPLPRDAMIVAEMDGDGNYWKVREPGAELQSVKPQ